MSETVNIFIKENLKFLGIQCHLVLIEKNISIRTIYLAKNIKKFLKPSQPMFDGVTFSHDQIDP